MLRPTHRGVLLPDELIDARESLKDTYAEQVKAGNRAFIDAYHALEDRATAAGVELEAISYPRRTDSGLAWACCDSDIGPACGHRA